MTRRLGCMVAVLVMGVTTLGATTAVARSTASTVEFRPVLADLPPESTTSTTMGPADRVDVGVKIAICDVVAVEKLPVVPTTEWRTAKPEECVVYPDLSAGRHSSRKYLGPAAVTTSDVKRARAEFVAGQGWTVKLTLTRAGAKAWDTLAEQQFHKQVAITASGRVASAPLIQPNNQTFTSFGGVAVISGGFAQKEAQVLAHLAAPDNGR